MTDFSDTGSSIGVNNPQGIKDGPVRVFRQKRHSDSSRPKIGPFTSFTKNKTSFHIGYSHFCVRPWHLVLKTTLSKPSSQSAGASSNLGYSTVGFSTARSPGGILCISTSSRPCHLPRWLSTDMGGFRLSGRRMGVLHRRHPKYRSRIKRIRNRALSTFISRELCANQE